MPIRQADETDVEGITDIVNQAFAPAERFLYDGERISAGEVREKLDHGCFLLDVDADGAARACVFVEVTGERGYFGLLAVLPAHQKRGIARMLVEAAESLCRERGCRTVEIDVVNHRHELFPFYARLGYRQVGQRPFASDRLRLPSHFVVLLKPLTIADG